MKEKGITTGNAIGITAVVVGIIVGSAVYLLAPGGGVSQEKYDEIQDEYLQLQELYEELQETEGVPQSIYNELLGDFESINQLVEERGLQFDLNKQSHWDITIDENIRLEHWVNTPVAFEYRTVPIGQQGPFTLGMVTCFGGQPWSRVYLAEFKRACNNLSPIVEGYVIMEAHGDVERQESMLEDMFSMWKAGEVDGIITDPLSPTALNDTLEEIYEAGCPLITFNGVTETTKITQHVGVDARTYGTIGGRWMAEELDGKGKVLMLEGIKGFSRTMAITDGFEDIFAEYPDLNIVAKEYGEWSYDLAKSKFYDMMAANPEFDAIIAHGGQMALAAIHAMEEEDMDPSKYAIAAEDQQGFMQKCEELGIPGIAVTHPTYNTAIAAREMVKILLGYPVTKCYMYPSAVITSDDFDKWIRPNAPAGSFATQGMTDEELTEILGG